MSAKPHLCNCHLMYYPKYLSITLPKIILNIKIPRRTTTTLLDDCPYCKRFDESEFHLYYNNLCLAGVHYQPD